MSLRIEEIGSSHIAKVDYLICYVALVLWLLMVRGKHPRLSLAAAVLSGLAVPAIIVFTIWSDNLSKGGCWELSMIAFGLLCGIWKWNKTRVKAKAVSEPRALSV